MTSDDQSNAPWTVERMTRNHSLTEALPSPKKMGMEAIAQVARTIPPLAIAGEETAEQGHHERTHPRALL